MKKVYVFLCAVFMSAPVQSQTTHVSGTLLSSEAKAMKLAHVHAVQYNSVKDKPQIHDVKADGSFAFELLNGWYYLEFSGVDHKQIRIPTMVYCCGNELKLAVGLEANTASEKIDSVTIVNESDKYSFAKQQRMLLQKDGTYRADVSSSNDMLGYQVIIYSGGGEDVHSINGTQSDRYEYDGGGDYRSFVKAVGGRAHISFDPRILPKTSGKESIEFKDEFSKSVNGILTEARQQVNTWYKEYSKKKGSQPYSYDAVAVRAAIREACLKETDPQLKQLRMMVYLSTPSMSKEENGVDPKFIDQILQTVPASSLVWGNYGQEIINAVSLSSNPRSEYAYRVLNEHPSQAVKAQILYSQIATLYKEKHEVDGLGVYERLVELYPDTYAAQRAKKEFNPQRKIKIGAAIPEFSFEGLPDSTTKVTPASVKGKWTLIDNWATWCGPCVAEMPSLHKAYEKFKDKNFTILSVSFDRGKPEISKFRGGKWSMPWMHSFSPGVWENEAARIFEVNGIPKPILIDPNGNIVAMDVDLRGEQLEKTLEKYLQ